MEGRSELLGETGGRPGTRGKSELGGREAGTAREQAGEGVAAAGAREEARVAWEESGNAGPAVWKAAGPCDW